MRAPLLIIWFSLMGLAEAASTHSAIWIILSAGLATIGIWMLTWEQEGDE